MSKMKKLALTAVLSALYALIAQMAIPFPGVPLTLQCFAVALGGYVLGWRIGLFSTVLYIGIGAVGLPVFSSFKGGIETLIGPTGGFVWGFCFLAVLCGLAKDKGKALSLILGALGLILCHLLGTVQFGLVTGCNALTAFITASLPYILKDALLLLAAHSLSTPILKAISRRR